MRDQPVTRLVGQQFLFRRSYRHIHRFRISIELLLQYCVGHLFCRVLTPQGRCPSIASPLLILAIVCFRTMPGTVLLAS